MDRSLSGGDLCTRWKAQMAFSEMSFQLMQFGKNVKIIQDTSRVHNDNELCDSMLCEQCEAFFLSILI